eukprot:1356850-Amorphochlora_amoeboformis.AAC.1
MSSRGKQRNRGACERNRRGILVIEQIEERRERKGRDRREVKITVRIRVKGLHFGFGLGLVLGLGLGLGLGKAQLANWFLPIVDDLKAARAPTAAAALHTETHI